jgi:hypothetical protein
LSEGTGGSGNCDVGVAEMFMVTRIMMIAMVCGAVMVAVLALLMIHEVSHDVCGLLLTK